MSKVRGLVNRIIRFSSVDGPGNRLVIFFQGCNMNCINCHNPHTIGICSHCGRCVDECPVQALSLICRKDGRKEIQFEESVCINCDHCLEVCPEDSNPRSHWMNVDELIQEILKVASFLSGITVSGGEASQQLEFVQHLFTRIKEDDSLSRLTTFIDSNGTLAKEGWEQLNPVLDGAMIDLKAIRSDVHQRLTGISNERVLESIQYLAQQQKLFEIRLLIIPEYNDDQEQIRETIQFLANISLAFRIRLIPFRQHGVRKEYQNLKPASLEQMEEIRRSFLAQGFKDIIIT